MRELKFRIWDKQTKNWLENSSSLHCFSSWTICPFTGNLVDYVGDYSCDSFTSSPAVDYYWQGTTIIKEPRYVIQQYTGLKDKNGKEIYEGDIVTYEQPYRASRLTHPATTDSYRTIVASVEYNEDSFEFEIEHYAIGSSMIKSRKDLQIIGSIFETPELLKQ